MFVFCFVLPCFYCGTIVGIRFCRCGWAPVRRFLCLLWRETHTKGLSARSPTRPGEDEERQGPRTVNRREELATVRERWWSERSSCWRRRWDLWTQSLGQPAREDESASLAAVWEFCSDTQRGKITGNNLVSTETHKIGCPCWWS